MNALRALAEKLGPRVQLPPVRALRDELGISLATLDRLLATLERQGLIERRHGKGIYVTERVAQRTYGVVFGRDVFAVGASPFWALLFQSLSVQSAADHHQLELFIDLPGAQRGIGHRAELLRRLAERQLHGLLVPCMQGAPEVEELRRHRVPAVALAYSHDLADSVVLDRRALVEQGVAALAQRGCRRIGLITAAPVPGGKGEADAFRTALAAHGLPWLPAWRWEQPVLGPAVFPGEAPETHEELGYRAIQNWVGMITPLEDAPAAPDRRALIQAPFPDGILITDDMLTRGALVALRKLGLMVGRDLQLATHANKGSPALLGYDTDLIRLEFDPAEIAQAMLGMLNDLVGGPRREPRTINIQPRVAQGPRLEEGRKP